MVACVEPEDCQSFCSDSARVRRADPGEEEEEGRERTKRFITTAKGKTKDWKENLEIKVGQNLAWDRRIDGRAK